MSLKLQISSKYDQLHRIKEANSSNNAYKETFSYDANGNIKTNTLHNQAGIQVDNATYHYFAETNKLHYISDSYGEITAGFDLMNQTTGNFAYDLIGNLVKDKVAEVNSIAWTAYHKRSEVIKEDGTTITYRYDAMNNRIYKKVEGQQGTETTHYLRDGTGNTLAIYKDGKLEELNIYGSSRLGTYNGKTVAGKRTLGNKRYELSNHLGNALVVITDNKIGKDIDTDFIADTYIALVVSERDYLAFGAVMHKRSYENEEYTYSFNGKELDKATGWQDYGFRDYNPVYKRFDRVDPLTFKYPELTPYQFASNTPIAAIDLDGLEADPSTEAKGNPYVILGTVATKETIKQTFLRRAVGFIMKGSFFLTALLTTNNKVGTAHPETTQIFMMSMQGNRFKELHRKRYIMQEGSDEWNEYQNFLRSDDINVGYAKQIAENNDWHIAKVQSTANGGMKYDIMTNDEKGILTIDYGESSEGLKITARIDMDETTVRGRDIFAYGLEVIKKELGVRYESAFFEANWTELMSSNLDKFNENLKEKMSPAAAAWDTFTGKVMKDAGYTKVSFPDNDVDLEGNNTDIYVKYER